MSLGEELSDEIGTILRERWNTRDGQKVPDTDDLKLSNDAVVLDATVLYADLADSTGLVDTYKPLFAAEIYKCYLHAAARIIRSEDGAITAYDGDRIMATFIGGSKNTSAVRSALKINYAVEKIINPAIQAQYTNTEFSLRQTIGIDTSSLHVARTGIRGSNDLVWVGRAANYAAKLCGLSADYPTWITAAVYNKLHESAKSSDGKAMWEARSWTAMAGMTIYRSNWWWSF
ncbi:adenylate/guanylate cyclase domain-containing protein [bacterium]|nr:adenylate/guanylate cyclase domain-containing protein [bacterium]